ncbi:GtrA family protein [Vagococcus sp.]|uniref:GtrA family protein n=1 Tax=Vagococcus sp. TaxID=1933889 RepID=UPI003F967818
MLKQKVILKYIVFGFLATLVYFATRFSLRIVTSSVLLPVIGGQLLALIFSFLCNKYFVFKHIKIGWMKSVRQFFDFFLSRLLVFLLDLGIAYVFVDRYAQFWMAIFKLNEINYQTRFFSYPILQRYIGSPRLLNEFIFTIFSQILCGIINYVVSKRVVFKIKKQPDMLSSF